MAAKKEIIIIINEDGTVELEQKGWTGITCKNSIDDIIDSLGKETKKTKTKEWYKKQKININQRRAD